MITLKNQDCLEYMRTMPEHSVDAILTDLPYGTTACAWDSVIPFEPMWEAVKHALKPNGAFVTTATQPFTTALIASNFKWFKYEWVWDKVRGVGFQVAKYRPMQSHENIIVFGRKSIKYIPIMERRQEIKKSKCYAESKSSPLKYNDGKMREYSFSYPHSILKISNAAQLGKEHPTQKPVALYKYLVQTYTNPGDVVLDMCMGSGTTGVACVELDRGFIGCETDAAYFEIAQTRIEDTDRQGRLFSPPQARQDAEQHMLFDFDSQEPAVQQRG